MVHLLLHLNLDHHDHHPKVHGNLWGPTSPMSPLLCNKALYKALGDDGGTESLNKAGNFLGGVVLGGGRPLISMMLVGWVDRSATFPPCKRLELLWLKMIEHRLEPERISLLRRTIPLAHLEFFGFHVRFRGIDNQAWEGRGNQILSPFGLSKWYPHAPHFQCFQCTAGFFCNTSLSLCEVQAKIWGQFRSRISSIQEFPPNSAKYPMPAGQLHN